MKKAIRKTNKLHTKKKKLVGKAVKKVILQKPAKVKVKVKTKVKTKPKSKPKIKPRTKPKMITVVSQPKLSKPVNKIVSAKPSLVRGQTALGPVNVKPYQSEKNEEYMSKKQLEHFRTVLLQWKGHLMAEVDRTMHHMQDEVSNYPDPVDRASQEEEFNLELRARDRERKLLRKIEETLSRINDNDYGYCDDCGAEIGTRRLEARPTATQCIECKTIAEIREKQVGDGG